MKLKNIQTFNKSFDNDDTNRYLPWLIACMVFLATLAVSAIFMVNSTTARLSSSFSNSITVQIPINEISTVNEKNKKLALDVLASYKGIKRANLVIPEDVSSLLEPWLGKYTNTQNLPIPIVIDAEIDRNASIDVQILTNKLSKLIPNITLDDHREWLNNFYRTLDALEVLASFVVLLIVLSAIVTIIFATRTSMGLQKDTISILHLIGATDQYIANQFSIRAAWLGIRGGIGGLVVAIPMLIGLEAIIKVSEAGVLPQLALDGSGWIGVILILPTVILIAMFTAYSTVLRTLSSMA